MELTCDTCGKKFNKSKSHLTKHNFCSRPCYDKFLVNNGTRRGCKVSEETRKKMSEAAMGEKNHFYGKHLTKEHRQKIGISNKGRKGAWTGKKQPEEMIIKRTEKLKGHICTEETRIKISKANSNKKRTKEQREINSKNTTERYLNDNFNPVKHSKQGYFYSDKNNCFLFYRSSYELEAYKHLEADKNVILYDRECIKIPYFYDGINRFYIPDIYIEFINGDKKLVEVKAEWAINNERNKIKFKVANDYCLSNNLTFEVWTEKELKIGLR